MSTQTPPGILTTRDLARAGIGQSQIRRALTDGHLRRLRRGWYATPAAHPAAARAVHAGGVLGCASALAFHGAWDVTDGTVHVRTDHHRTGPLPAGFLRCPPPDDAPAPVHAVDDLEMALRCAARCLPPDELVTCCDSLVHRRLATMEQLRHLLSGQPAAQRALDRCDRAESGTESLVRLRLRRRRVQLQTQVWIDGVGRVDLLVGRHLVIEVDSRAHHTGEEHYRSDRARDLALMARGYLVVRLTYEQVLFDWPATEAMLLDIIRSTGHRARP